MPQRSQLLRRYGGSESKLFRSTAYNFSFFLGGLGSLSSDPWGRTRSRYALSSSSSILLMILFATAGNLLPNSYCYTAIYESRIYLFFALKQAKKLELDCHLLLAFSCDILQWANAPFTLVLYGNYWAGGSSRSSCSTRQIAVKYSLFYYSSFWNCCNTLYIM